jgi:soluble lytic murein transglycosylase
VAASVTSNAPPTEPLMRALMAAGLFDDALKEVQFAQRTWGDSPALQATSAWIRAQQAQQLRADERFAALRGSITTMRRAYPQFLSADGTALPVEVLRIIFPLDYWDLIEKYSKANGLDPYLVSALMAQESTFTAEIRSAANARGLMQVMPGTGRLYARKMGIRPFTTASLSQPDTNVRIGMQYFKDLVDRFGGVHYALASYNAGESRVSEWIKDTPDLPQDEFIDNIPFPETQNYVKRILGTAEDYRRLYGTGQLAPNRRPIAD